MNNQIKSDNYNNGFKSNSITIFMYKSSRKNAKTANAIKVNHLISKEVKLHDERIVQQFVGTLEAIVYNSKQFNNHLEILAHVNVFKNASFIDANRDLYCNTNNLIYGFQRVRFYSLENCINFIFSLYCLIYPYNEIDLSQDIYNNPSVRYFIKMYYENVKEVK